MDHVLLFQYGDYGAAWRDLTAGHPELYRDQKASVDFVSRFAGRFHVTTLAICDRPHHEELAPNLWSIGMTPEDAYSARKIWPMLNSLAPDRIIVRTPHRHALLWSRWRGIPTLPIFADIFANTTLRQRLENRMTRWAVSGSHIPCVSNHSLNASLSMQDCLDLPPERIVPWDRASLKPEPHPKAPAPTDRPFHAFYAGLITETKGIGDCLEAAALLIQQGLKLHIDFAGSGDLEAWRHRAKTLGLAENTRFLGNLPNTEVRRSMRAADLVLVPSRHDYAEGLPNTLCEALAARTPLVISDHPAFASRLQKDRDCMIFSAANPKALAAEILRLQQDPTLQARLSKNAPSVLAALHFGLDWFALIRKFLDDPASTNGWVARNNLTALQTILQRTDHGPGSTKP